MAALVLIIVILGVGYFVSLRVHPLRRCPGVQEHARAAPRRHLPLLLPALPACGGRGRKDRLGTKIFFGGTNDSGFWG